MPRYDFITKRIYVDAPLAGMAEVVLERKRASYLLNVLRFRPGDKVLVFNGRDGEWLAEIVASGRKDALLKIGEQTRPQPQPCALVYMFAPLKITRLDYMVQKAVEMGAGVLQPVITEFTQFSRLNPERIRSNIIEASEQCGILSIPEYSQPAKLDVILQNWPKETRLIFCDEGEESQNPLQFLKELRPGPLAVLIGPEGGFSETERELLRSKSYVTAIPLGPRVLRADTAAVAALAIIQATIGDWE